MKKIGHIAPLALTMGEPAGIGPELIFRLWKDRKNNGLKPFVYIGSKDNLPLTNLESIETPQEAFEVFGHALPVIDIPLKAPQKVGCIEEKNAPAVVAAIDLAVSYCLDRTCSGMVTGPINKAALYSVGFDAPGHTEYLARLSGLADDHSVMMLTAQDLKVIPVTIHVPLKDVAKTLTADKIFHAAMVAAKDLKIRFGIPNPRIAIAGLNPHAGENGTIGIEEATHIMPAIWRLRDHGITVTDPLPADTLFHSDARTQYDIVLCMYHDQALIPVKTLDFWGGVNVTLGLPFIRTSPDHGTAVTLAGKGVAKIDSILAATRLAQNMAESEAVCE